MKKFYLTILLIFTNCFPGLEKSSLDILTFLQVFSSRSNSFLFHVSGLSSGSLVLNLNSSQEINLSSNGETSIAINLPTGTVYELSIDSQPSLHTCEIDNLSGTISSLSTSFHVNCFSLIKQSPPNMGILLPNAKVRLQFSDTILLPGSCTFSNGTLDVVSGTPTITLETTTLKDDTFVVDPSPSTWKTGLGKSIDAVCKSASGNSMPSGGFTLTFIIPDTFRYVADSTGNDFNNGLTPISPFRSINKAILDMTSCVSPSVCVVLVEEGNYDPTSQGQNLILIEDRISIVGGYKKGSSYSINDSTLYQSLVFMDIPPANCAISTIASPCASIAIPNTVTSATSIVGLKVIAGDISNPGNVSVGIVISGGAANIIYNDITSGTATQGDTIGMLINNFGTNITLDPLGGIIRYNTIRAGSCSSANCRSSGIYLSATIPGKYPFIANNKVYGGSCSSNFCSSYGLFTPIAMSNTNMDSIIGNTFTGGTISAGLSTESTGMFINNNLVGELILNLLVGGSAVTSKGLHLNSNMTLNIGNSSGDGNVIVGGTGTLKSYGVYLAAGGTLNFNTIFGGSVISSTNSESYGIFSSSGQILAYDNNISGGTSTSNGAASFASAYGIFSNATSAGSSLLRNNISGGFANHKSSGNAISKGIYSNLGNTLTIYNNLVDGGISVVDIPSQTATSIGIEISQNNTMDKIYFNTISSGQAKDISTSLAITNIGSQSKDIRYNIFMNENSTGSRVCILHEGGTGFNNLTYNNFYNCPILMDYNPTAASYSVICPGGNLGIPGCGSTLGGAIFNNNQSVSPNFVTSFGINRDWNFTTSSPCSLTRLPDPGLITNDYFLNLRPGGNGLVSAGAIEYDGSCL